MRLRPEPLHEWLRAAWDRSGTRGVLDPSTQECFTVNTHQPTSPSPSNSNTFVSGDDSSTGAQPDSVNSIHPLHGMSAAERSESRQRVFAKALAEILRRRPQRTITSTGAEIRS